MQDWSDIRAWRKAERARLIEERQRVPSPVRAAATAAVAARVAEEIASSGAAWVGIYWPFKGELDFRPLADLAREAGIGLALPVVVEKAAPLEFRAWAPGDALERGVWNIPVPVKREAVAPDLLIAPLVGFDGAGYRLGYGGGYYDRTLAARSPRPRVIGAGFTLSRLDTIHPQAHDIPMSLIVTEDGVAARA